MKFMSWNIRSIDKHFEELENYLNDGNIEVICINETWGQSAVRFISLIKL